MFLKIAAGILIGGAIGAVLGYYGKCSSGSCPLTANPYRGAICGALMGVLMAAAFSSGFGNNAKAESLVVINIKSPEFSLSYFEYLQHIGSIIPV